MSHDIDDTIDNNLAKPKMGLVDGQRFEQHSIPDQIKGAKYLKNQDNVAGNPHKGLIFNTFTPPGTV